MRATGLFSQSTKMMVTTTVTDGRTDVKAATFLNCSRAMKGRLYVDPKLSKKNWNPEMRHIASSPG
jgi:hypothetical protein